MTDHRVAACRSCGAPIIWTRTLNNRRLPVDAQPSSAGTVRLGATAPDGVPVSTPLSPLETAPAARGRGEQLYVAHFATCPDAQRWRKS